MSDTVNRDIKKVKKKSKNTSLVRDENGKFVAGNKEGGKIALPEKTKEILKKATPEAAQFLVDTMKNKEVKTETRVECAKLIIERVHGKPLQPLDIDAAKSLFNVNIQVIEQDSIMPAKVIDV